MKVQELIWKNPFLYTFAKKTLIKFKFVKYILENESKNIKSFITWMKLKVMRSFIKRKNVFQNIICTLNWPTV